MTGLKLKLRVNPKEGGARAYIPESVLALCGIKGTVDAVVQVSPGEIRLRVGGGS
jgi:hypothetical protein